MAVTASFLRFLMVGVANTLVGYGAILLFQLVLGLQAVAANASGYAVGMVLSYLLNRQFTFRSQTDHRRGVPAFLAAAAVCYGVNLLVLSAASQFWPRLPAAGAQGLAVGAYTISFYLVSRRFVFAMPGGSSPMHHPTIEERQ